MTKYYTIRVTDYPESLFVRHFRIITSEFGTGVLLVDGKNNCHACWSRVVFEQLTSIFNKVDSNNNYVVNKTLYFGVSVSHNGREYLRVSI